MGCPGPEPDTWGCLPDSTQPRAPLSLRPQLIAEGGADSAQDSGSGLLSTLPPLPSWAAGEKGDGPRAVTALRGLWPSGQEGWGGRGV